MHKQHDSMKLFELFFVDRQIHGDVGLSSAAAVIVYAMTPLVQTVISVSTKLYRTLTKISECYDASEYLCIWMMCIMDYFVQSFSE